jgi:hypothetical protein
MPKAAGPTAGGSASSSRRTPPDPSYSPASCLKQLVKRQKIQITESIRLISRFILQIISCPRSTISNKRAITMQTPSTEPNRVAKATPATPAQTLRLMPGLYPPRRPPHPQGVDFTFCSPNFTPIYHIIKWIDRLNRCKNMSFFIKIRASFVSFCIPKPFSAQKRASPRNRGPRLFSLARQPSTSPLRHLLINSGVLLRRAGP